MRAQLSNQKKPLGKPAPAVKKASSKLVSKKAASAKAKPAAVAKKVTTPTPKTAKKVAPKIAAKTAKIKPAPKPIKKVAVTPAVTKKAVKPVALATKAVVKKVVKIVTKPTPAKVTSKAPPAPKGKVGLGHKTTPAIPTQPKLIAKAKAKAKATSAALPRRQTTQALRAFEQAVKVFNLRQFSEAKHLFEELQKQYFQELEIIARSQMYIQVCNGKLGTAARSPRDAEELYDRGVVALNVGNFVQARTFFEKALKLRPDDSYTLYSLAATHAQSGATDQALTYLAQAVQKQPRLRHRALNDNDFSALKEDRRFLEMLGAASPFDLLESRRDLV